MTDTHRSSGYFTEQDRQKDEAEVVNLRSKLNTTPNEMTKAQRAAAEARIAVLNARLAAAKQG